MAGSILVVLTPATTYDLTTLATLKDELDITDNSQDGKLKRWIEDSSAQVADYLGRTLGLERLQETFRYPWTYGSGAEGLRLSGRPVVDIETVTLNGAALASTEWELDAEKGLLYRATNGATIVWPSQTGTSVVVTYSAGYDLLDGVPRGIEQAVLIVLRHRRSYASRSDPYLKAEDIDQVARVEYWPSSGSTSGSRSSAIPPEAQSLLDRYRDFHIA